MFDYEQKNGAMKFHCNDFVKKKKVFAQSSVLWHVIKYYAYYSDTKGHIH